MHMFKAILSVVLLSLVSGCVTSESPHERAGPLGPGRAGETGGGRPAAGDLGTAY
jgi:hypothetical protein